jgi:hypothetical protein
VHAQAETVGMGEAVLPGDGGVLLTPDDNIRTSPLESYVEWPAWADASAPGDVAAAPPDATMGGGGGVTLPGEREDTMFNTSPLPQDIPPYVPAQPIQVRNRLPGNSRRRFLWWVMGCRLMGCRSVYRQGIVRRRPPPVSGAVAQVHNARDDEDTLLGAT